MSIKLTYCHYNRQTDAAGTVFTSFCSVFKMSGVFNIKTRERSDSRIARDGLRGFNQLPTLGKKLTGLQFSGKSSKIVSKSSACLTEEATSKGSFLEPYKLYGETAKKGQVKANKSTLGVPGYLSKSAPTLSRDKNSTSAVFTANLPDVRRTRVALKIPWKTSDSFVQSLKTFRANKEFRTLAVRRLSEGLQLQQVSYLRQKETKLSIFSDRESCKNSVND